MAGTVGTSTLLGADPHVKYSRKTGISGQNYEKGTLPNKPVAMWKQSLGKLWVMPQLL
jgi:hypothetical protein